MNRKEKKNLMKERIIKSLFMLLENKTWDMVSSEDICKSASVSRRTLYSYYGSQDEMYLEIVKISFEKINKRMELSVAEKSDIYDKVISLGNAYLKFMIENPDIGNLVTTFNESEFSASYPEKIKEISKIANLYEPFSFFGKEVDEKEGLTRQMAIMLWSYIQGLAQLINSKALWMEDYYGDSIENIVDEQLKGVKKIMKVVKNEKKEG